MPTLPAAISRSAITVGLSRFGSTSGVAPCAELARAVGRGERQLEAVGDALQAVVNGDAGHGLLVRGIWTGFRDGRSSCIVPGGAAARRQPRTLDRDRSRRASSKSLLIITYSNSAAWLISSAASPRRRRITASESWPRARMRRSSSAIDGGRMKMPMRVRDTGCRTCCAPCQSISSRRSWPRARASLDHRLRGAVAVAVHLGAFEELAALEHAPRTRRRSTKWYSRPFASPGRGARVV